MKMTRAEKQITDKDLEEIYQNFALRQYTKKDGTIKKIGYLESKINPYVFGKLKQYLATKDIFYSHKIKAFFIEDVEKKEKTKSLEDMQKEFLAKNKVKKIDDEKYIDDNHFRKSKTFHNKRKDVVYEAIYDGLYMEDDKGYVFKVKFFSRRVSNKAKFSNKNEISQQCRTMYTTEERERNPKLAQSTIKQKLDSGLWKMSKK